MSFSTKFSGFRWFRCFLIDLPESLLPSCAIGRVGPSPSWTDMATWRNRIPEFLMERQHPNMSCCFLSFPPFFMGVHQLMFRIRLKVPEGENCHFLLNKYNRRDRTTRQIYFIYQHFRILCPVSMLFGSLIGPPQCHLAADEGFGLVLFSSNILKQWFNGPTIRDLWKRKTIVFMLKQTSCGINKLESNLTPTKKSGRKIWWKSWFANFPKEANCRLQTFQHHGSQSIQNSPKGKSPLRSLEQGFRFLSVHMVSLNTCHNYYYIHIYIYTHHIFSIIFRYHTEDLGLFLGVGVPAFKKVGIYILPFGGFWDLHFDGKFRLFRLLCFFTLPLAVIATDDCAPCRFKNLKKALAKISTWNT